MPQSLIEELPRIVSEGKKEVERILSRISSSNKVVLQTNELVLPCKDKSGLFRGKMPEFKKQAHENIGQGQLALPGADDGQLTLHQEIGGEWVNRLVYGDNLLVMEALLAGDPLTGLPSMRGKIDLIYIDPPFDSKADYRTKITLPGTDIEQKPTVLEQAAYSDTWKNGTVSYLEMLYPRLVLMRELLSEQGSICVHIDWHVGHYVKTILDEIFGRERFFNEIIWQRTGAHNDAGRFGIVHDVLFMYGKSGQRIFNPIFVEHSEEHIDTRFNMVDEKNRKPFFAGPITAPGDGPERLFRGKQIKPPKGRHWSYSQEGIDDLEKKGLIYYTAIPQDERMI